MNRAGSERSEETTFHLAPPADRISIHVRSGRGGMLLFAALSIGADDVAGPHGGSSGPAGPVCVRRLRPALVGVPRVMTKLAQHMAAAPEGVHRLTRATRVEITVHQPGIPRRLLGASRIGGSWLRVLQEAVECRIRETTEI